MQSKLLLIPVIFSVLLLGFSFNQDALATTNIVSNGSFENGLTSWTVGGDGVDKLSTGWQASDGIWTIDLSALGAGSVSQNIATVVGTIYDVTFDMSGNPTDAPDTKSLTVSAAGNSQTYNYTTPIGSTKSTLVYVPNTFSFTATSTTATLTFTSNNDQANGPMLDNIAILADLEAPVVIVSSATEEATSSSGASVSFTSSATDDTDGSITPSCNYASGDTFAIGSTTVTCTATDVAGNVGTGTGTITVQDTTAPDVTVPGDITLHATSPAGSEVTFSSSATDIVDGTVSTTCTPSSGSTFAIDTTEVTCEATDAAGNTGSATFNVTVFNTAPVCSDATPSSDSLWPVNHKYNAISISGITDADGDATTLTINSIQQDEAVDAKGSGNTSHDGEIDGDTANLRAERTGNGDGRIYEISFTADDGLGGECSGSVTVGVPHDKKSTAVDSGYRFDSTLE